MFALDFVGTLAGLLVENRLSRGRFIQIGSTRTTMRLSSYESKANVETRLNFLAIKNTKLEDQYWHLNIHY